jgi:hypothetical protein
VVNSTRTPRDYVVAKDENSKMLERRGGEERRDGGMRKLEEVREAKALMTEALEWSVFQWMFQKSKVREVADEANAALDALERAIKKRWSDEAKAVYKRLAAKSGKAARKDTADPDGERSLEPAILALVEKAVEADALAMETRMDAEKTFDEAERELDLTLAREGCRKAIHGWSLHEKAIRSAEAVAEAMGAGTAGAPASQG